MTKECEYPVCFGRVSFGFVQTTSMIGRQVFLNTTGDTRFSQEYVFIGLFNGTKRPVYILQESTNSQG